MPKFIRFFGGPLDGHRQDLSQRKTALPTLLNLEISPNTLRLLAKQPLKPGVPTTSVAVYQLRTVDAEQRYCFVAAKKPAQKPTADR